MSITRSEGGFGISLRLRQVFFPFPFGLALKAGCITAVLLAACRAAPTDVVIQSPIPSDETPRPRVSSTAPPPSASPSPSPSPVPLAAEVNGEAILLEVYESHLARFDDARAEVGTFMATEEAASQVLEDLVDQVLLAQAAREANFMVDDATLNARMDDLIQEAGGTDQFSAWLDAQHYTEARFRQDLAQAMAAAWMRDQILAAVPETAEQVHALQILLYNSEDAQEVMDQLQAGADFETLSRVYDPVGFGDLGWFPRGYLTEPLLETAVFSLQIGEISQIVETRLGFHIVQVIDRQSDRPLNPDARIKLQAQALQTWLVQRRGQSDIKTFIGEKGDE